MHKDFVRVLAVTPEVVPADPARNAENTLLAIRGAGAAGLVVLPELGLTGAACGSLFGQDALLDAAEEALLKLISETRASGALVAAGLPVRYGTGLYSCAAVFCGGALLGVIPKIRVAAGDLFRSGAGLSGTVTLCGQSVPFGTDLLFDAGDGFRAAFELGEDLTGCLSPSERYAAAGASVVGHLSAFGELAGQDEWVCDILRVQSERLHCGYIHANTGSGETTSRCVYSGRRVIAENGTLLERNGVEEWHGVTAAELDLGLLAYDRRSAAVYTEPLFEMRVIPFKRQSAPFALTRRYSPEPFVPEENDRLAARCREVMAIQTHGLRTRLSRLPGTGAAVAVSGGLDSTLALLAAHRAAKQEGRKLIPVTMPGPGTTERTIRNSEALCKALDAPLRTVPIHKALEEHLKNIGHDGQPDVVYENAQARERMQVIMDIANAERAIVVGSADLSEAALGFTTFGGDHTSMYGVNLGVPKTLIRHIVRYTAVKSEKALRAVLFDILDTPISPELLPVDEYGTQDQRSEDILGDYLVHDFYLYWFLRHGYSREKLLLAANRAFEGRYLPESLDSVLTVFLTRFTNAQFKRASAPDGVRVGSVSLAPYDWSMPGDLARLP